MHGNEGEAARTKGAENPDHLVLRDMWDRLAEEVNRVLDSVTLAELCDAAARMKSQGDSFMYHI